MGADAPWRPRTASGDHALLWFALAWQAGWTAAEFVLAPQPVLATLLVASAATGVLVLVATLRTGSATKALAVAVAVNLTALTLASAVATLAGSSRPAELFIVPAAVPVAALTCAWWAGLGITALFAGLQFALSAGQSQVASALIVANGCMLIAVRAGVRRAAERSAAAEAELVRADISARTAALIRVRLAEQERLLHGRVLNTLTAIAQGVGAEPQLAVLRRTCADDAALLRSLAGAADMTAVVDLQDVIEWLQASGVEVELDLNHLGALPSDVRTAFTTGIREALTNAHRHASATAVRAVARRESGSVVVVVEDDGRGISPDATNRFGVEHSMRRAMTDIGGRTSIDSNPGRGTIVEFSWTPDVLGSQGPNVRGGAVAFAGPFLAAALILALVAVFTSPGARMWGAAAGALVAALVVGLAFDVRQGRIGWQWTVATCAAVPLILSLHSPSSPGGPESSVDWATRAAAALVIVVVATGPWWAWIPAVGTWLVAFEDRLAAPLLPTVFLILGSSLIARSVRASRGRERALLDRLARSRAEEQGEGEAARRIAERYRVLSASRAGELLAAVADGSADPGDVEFRSRCAAEELFIRSAMRLDPGGDPFHALVGQLLVTARRAGIRLEVDLADTPEPGGLDSPPLRRTLTALVRSLDGTGRLSCRLEHDAYVLRLVGPSLPRLPAVELGTLTEMSEAGIMLWELRQPAE